MRENKKVNVKNIYYATLKNRKTGEKKYMLCLLKSRIKSCVLIDLKTDNEYYLYNNGDLSLLGGYCLNESVICGITPYSSIVKDTFSIVSINDLLKKDQSISKIYSEEYDEYIYRDTEEFQKTLAIIKPDGIKNITKIIEMMYKEGLCINKYEVRSLDEEILSEHYSHLVDKPFYPKLKEYMMSGDVVIMELSGENAVDKLRTLMGPTDSTKAPKGTIRGKFGTDVTYNAIHGSDSVENAKIELNRFFRQKQKRI